MLDDIPAFHPTRMIAYSFKASADQDKKNRGFTDEAVVGQILIQLPYLLIYFIFQHPQMNSIHKEVIHLNIEWKIDLFFS